MSVTRGIHRSLQARRRALATSCDGRRRSWAEFAERVAALAGGLRRLGVGKNDRVAILMLNSDRYLECYGAVAWAGCVLVPLNTRWSEREQQEALSDCQPQCLIVDEHFAALGQRIAAAALQPPVVIRATGSAERAISAVDYEDLIGRSTPIADEKSSGDALAGLFYTGGTTGSPKGVMLTHAGVTSVAMSVLAEGCFREDAVYLHAAPMFHMADGCAIYSLLTSGGASAIIPAFTPTKFLETVQSERVTESLLVPTMIQMLVDHPALGTFDLSSLRRVLYGASPMSEAVLDRALQRLPHVEFIQAYGMTEVSAVAVLLHAEHLSGAARELGRHRAAGRPTYGVELKIVGASGQELPAGEVGEVLIRSPGLMAGYWRKPEESRAAVSDGWMHTGDGGYVDADGFVYIVDRIKDMIVSGGENVYSAEVENVIARMPAVAQAAVIAIPSQEWGEQVHAVVALHPGAAATEEDIIAFCKGNLAGYKCPRSVDVRSEPLPLTGAGKIKKQALREPYWARESRRVS
jgi:long-chain acyl-CoA synthetase